MSQYLSQTRIEEPVLLEPTDISFLRERIFETETQVENLEAQISELTRQRDSKLVELASFRNILSPVRRIPAEILSELFELACLPRDGIFHSKHTLVSYTYNLSSVCAAWRQIAHTIPRLWSKLCFDYGRHRKASMTDIECVGEWVNRSRGLPLDVYLSLSLKSDSTQFLEKILDFRHRIRTLNVAGYAESYLALFRLPRSSFPRLEEVTLSIKEDSEAAERRLPNKIEAFLGASNLHNVQIRGTSLSLSLLKVLVFPEEQLKTLMVASSVQILNPSVFVDTLYACKGLVNLEIDLPVALYIHTNKMPSVDIWLPALKSLKIRCHDDIRHYDFLRCLTLPLLEHLSFCGDGVLWDVYEVFPPAAADFQRRSATSLSSLTLENLNCNDVEILTENLGIFPEVQALQLHRVRVDVNLLLRALTYTEGSQVLLPQLTHLGLKSYEQHTTLSDDLTSMVLSRWWSDDERATSAGVARLQKVNLGGFLHDEQITRISKLPGLKIDYMQEQS